MSVLNVYSDRQKDGKLILPGDFGRNQSIALTRLVIKWNSRFVDKEIFGKVETVISSSIDSKPEQLCTFTKAKNTTMTDIFVANPIYYFRKVSPEFCLTSEP